MAALGVPGGLGVGSPAAAAGTAAWIEYLASEPPTITVERTRSRVVAGKPVTYQVTVANPDPEAELSTVVRVSLPPQLQDVSAPDGEVADGYATWLVSVPPAQQRSLQVSGSYTLVDAAAGVMGWTAVTACLVSDDGHPQVCATDLAEVAAAGARWWWLAALGAVAAVAALLLPLRRLIMSFRPWRRQKLMINRLMGGVSWVRGSRRTHQRRSS